MRLPQAKPCPRRTASGTRFPRRWRKRGPLSLLLLSLVLAGGCTGGGDGGGDGSSDTGEDRPHFEEGPAPSAAFSADPAQGLAPVTVTLDASASQASEGRLVRFQWRFPGGRVAAGRQVEHRFSAGRHQVRLTVTDSNGRQAVQRRTLTYAEQVGLSGTLTGPSFLTLDSDVNDPNLFRQPNDGVSEAQPLPNPALVAGYVTATATATPTDVFATQADPQDIYQLQLAKGQGVTLYVSDHRADDPTRVDLDLGIFAPSDLTTPVASSVDVTATESLTVPSAGTYYLVVEAAQGASNYNLAIGSQPAQGTSSGGRLRAEGDFVPGEVIADCTREAMAGIRGKDKGAVAGVAVAGEGQERRGPQLLQVEAEAESDRGLAAGMVRPGARAPVGAVGSARGATVELVKALRGRPGCRYAAPNYRRQALITPNDAYYGEQWALPQLRLPEAWEIARNGGPVVAVVDTGRVDHPDLADRYTGTGYDFIADPERALDGDGIDADPTNPGDPEATAGTFHGTHVAGTIAAAGNNDEGVSGVVWGGRMMAVRALGPQGGTSYDLIQAVRYAAGLSNDSGTTPPEPAKVINLSLGGLGYSQAEAQLFDTLREKGVFVAAAAGNQGKEATVYPAGYDGVIGVGAVDRNGDRAPYSNQGPHLSLMAPGGNLNQDADGDGRGDGILSTWAEDNGGERRYVYAFLQGTSMATPHVAGAIALMKAEYPGLSPAELDGLLESGRLTQDLGPPGWDAATGYGLLNTLASLRAARRLAEGGTLPAVLELSPSSLIFGVSRRQQALSVANGGGGTLTVASVRSPATWVTIQPQEVDAQGLGAYQVTVDRAGLSPGSYRSQVVVTTDGGKEQVVPVTLTVAAGDAVESRPGKRYVLLMDPATRQSLQETRVAPQETAYPFSFSVGPGQYRLAAGTDMDNDGVICDDGEACGVYPLLGEARTLTVAGGDGDRPGLDFSAGLRWDLEGTVRVPGGLGYALPEDGHALP